MSALFSLSATSTLSLPLLSLAPSIYPPLYLLHPLSIYPLLSLAPSIYTPSISCTIYLPPLSLAPSVYPSIYLLHALSIPFYLLHPLSILLHLLSIYTSISCTFYLSTPLSPVPSIYLPLYLLHLLSIHPSIYCTFYLSTLLSLAPSIYPVSTSISPPSLSLTVITHSSPAPS